MINHLSALKKHACKLLDLFIKNFDKSVAGDKDRETIVIRQEIGNVLRKWLIARFNERINNLDSLQNDISKHTELYTLSDVKESDRNTVEHYKKGLNIITKLKLTGYLKEFLKAKDVNDICEIIKLKENITMLFSRIQEKQICSKHVVKPCIKKIKKAKQTIIECVYKLNENVMDFPKNLDDWEQLLQSNSDLYLKSFYVYIDKLYEDAQNDRIVFNANSPNIKEYNEFLNNSCEYTRSEMQLFSLNLYKRFSGNVHWTWIAEIVNAFYNTSYDCAGIRSNMSEALLHKEKFLEKIGLWYLTKELRSK